jgi:hypothetical protein
LLSPSATNTRVSSHRSGGADRFSALAGRPDDLELKLLAAAAALMLDIELGACRHMKTLTRDLDGERFFGFDGVRKATELFDELAAAVRPGQIPIFHDFSPVGGALAGMPGT